MSSSHSQRLQVGLGVSTRRVLLRSCLSKSPKPVEAVSQQNGHAESLQVCTRIPARAPELLETVTSPIHFGGELNSDRTTRRRKGCGSWVAALGLALTATSLLPYPVQFRKVLTRCAGSGAGGSSWHGSYLNFEHLGVQIPSPTIYHLCDVEKVT